jgi:hypothetical protein
MAQMYGARTGVKKADTGIRNVAQTYGKAAFFTHSSKSTGTFVVESEHERLVAQLLTIDPDTRTFRAQPLTVDLVDGSLLRTPEEKSAARDRYKGGAVKPSFYTPDFSTEVFLGTEKIIEVKSQAYLGDEEYQRKLDRAADILWRHGMEFVQVVVPSYWRHPILTNAPLIYQASMRQDLRPGPEVLAQIENLSQCGASTLGAFYTGLGMDTRMGSVLVAFGALSVDLLKHELRSATPACPAHGGLDHLSLVGRLTK